MRSIWVTITRFGSFNLIYRVSVNRYKGVRQRSLSAKEAIATRPHGPILCAKKSSSGFYSFHVVRVPRVRQTGRVSEPGAGRTKKPFMRSKFSLVLPLTPCIEITKFQQNCSRVPYCPDEQCRKGRSVCHFMDYEMLTPNTAYSLKAKQ